MNTELLYIRKTLTEISDQVEDLAELLDAADEQEVTSRRKWPDSKIHQFILEHQGCTQNDMIEEWSAPQPSSINNPIIRLARKGLVIRDKSQLPYRLYAATESEIENEE